MANPFEQLISETEQPEKSVNQLTGVRGRSSINTFQDLVPEHEESRAKSIARWLYQIPSGIAQAKTYPLDLLELISTYSALDPEEIDQIRRISEQEGVPFDEEKYVQSVHDAASFFPTQGNLERYLEERFDLPLNPKTRGQGLLKLASTAAGFPKDVGKKAAAAAIAPTTSAGLEKVGVPEPLADIVGLGASQVGAQIGESLLKKRPKVTDIERRAIEGVGPSGPSGPPGGIPASPFELAEEFRSSFEGAPPDPPGPSGPSGPSPTFPRQSQFREASSLANRVREGGENLGISPSPLPSGGRPELKNTVGRTISPYEVHNSTNAGRTIRREVMRIDQGEYENVNRLYELSRELNEGIIDRQPELADALLERIEELERIPSRSSPTTQLLRSNEQLLDRLVTYDEEGNISGYRPISNQDLINQIQESRRIIDFDFAHGNAKNIFRPFINEMQEAVIHSSESQNPDAANAFRDARTAYRNWSNTYDNDYIRPLRDLSNRDFSKMFKQSLDTDNFNVLRDVLERTPAGEEIVNVLQREIVEDKLGKILKEPSKVSSREIERNLRELEAVISPEQVQEIRRTIQEHQRRFPRRVERIEKEPISQIDRRAADMFKKTPEQIERLLDSRSGIRELEESATTPRQKEIFSRLKQRKIQSILRENNIEKEFTGEQLFNVLNKEKNFELMSELTSREMATELRETAKEISERKFTKENVKKVSKALFKFKIIHTLLSL